MRVHEECRTSFDPLRKFTVSSEVQISMAVSLAIRRGSRPGVLYTFRTVLAPREPTGH